MMTAMENHSRPITAKNMKVAIGFLAVFAVLSIVLSLVITSILFGKGNPPPAAGIAWIILSCLLFSGFAFLGLIYLVEFIHTRAQNGSKVSWKNYGLRVLLSLSSLIGPYWMLDSHPYLAQRPVVLNMVNVLVAGLSVLLLLWAFGRRFPIPGHSQGVEAEEPNKASERPVSESD